MPLPDLPVYAAVLLDSRHDSVGLIEAIKDGRRLSGAGFETHVGRLADQMIAAAWPAEAGGMDYERVLSAMFAAYRPRLVIGAGFSTRIADEAPLGAKIVADRVIGADGESLRLVGPVAGSLDTLIGALSEPSESPHSDALACNAWCHRFASACALLEQPAAVATVVSRDPGEPTEEETANVLRQESTAARAGAVVRAAWRKPSSLVELLKRKSRGWEHQEALAGVIEALLVLPTP